MKVLIVIGKGKINYFNTALNSSICLFVSRNDRTVSMLKLSYIVETTGISLIE